jgi:hypothetical protein
MMRTSRVAEVRSPIDVVPVLDRYNLRDQDVFGKVTFHRSGRTTILKGNSSSGRLLAFAIDDLKRGGHTVKSEVRIPEQGLVDAAIAYGPRQSRGDGFHWHLQCAPGAGYMSVHTQTDQPADLKETLRDLARKREFLYTPASLIGPGFQLI